MLLEIEEREPGRVEAGDEGQPEDVTVEGHRAVEILDALGDLVEETRSGCHPQTIDSKACYVKWTPMDDVEGLATDLNSVAIHLVRRLRRADQSLGVTAARLSALSVLVFGGPQRMQELAEAEQVAGPTMSKIVGALEAEGWCGACRIRPNARGDPVGDCPGPAPDGEGPPATRRTAGLRSSRRWNPPNRATLHRAVDILRRLEQG